MTEPWHGTPGGYTNRRCRKKCCREAIRLYMADYRRRKAIEAWKDAKR